MWTISYRQSNSLLCPRWRNHTLGIKTHSDFIKYFKNYARLKQGLINKVNNLEPSAYEAGFLSIQHDDAVTAKMLEATQKAFAKI